jgi:hypothetical protein
MVVKRKPPLSRNKLSFFSTLRFVNLGASISELGLPVVCIESRQACQALRSRATHKTDRNDARGLAHLARTGFFKPVHVKSLRLDVLPFFSSWHAFLPFHLCPKPIGPSTEMECTSAPSFLARSMIDGTGPSMPSPQSSTGKAISVMLRPMCWVERKAKILCSSASDATLT